MQQAVNVNSMWGQLAASQVFLNFVNSAVRRFGSKTVNNMFNRVDENGMRMLAGYFDIPGTPSAIRSRQEIGKAATATRKGLAFLGALGVTPFAIGALRGKAPQVSPSPQSPIVPQEPIGPGPTAEQGPIGQQGPPSPQVSPSPQGPFAQRPISPQGPPTGGIQPPIPEGVPRGTEERPGKLKIPSIQDLPESQRKQASQVISAIAQLQEKLKKGKVKQSDLAQLDMLTKQLEKYKREPEKQRGGLTGDLEEMFQKQYGTPGSPQEFHQGFKGTEQKFARPAVATLAGRVPRAIERPSKEPAIRERLPGEFKGEREIEPGRAKFKTPPYSSVVQYGHYDRNAQKLSILFPGGNLYDYFDVPEDAFMDMIEGADIAQTEGGNAFGFHFKGKDPSIGASFNQRIKNAGYQFSKVKLSDFTKEQKMLRGSDLAFLASNLFEPFLGKRRETRQKQKASVLAQKSKILAKLPQDYLEYKIREIEDSLGIKTIEGITVEKLKKQIEKQQ